MNQQRCDGGDRPCGFDDVLVSKVFYLSLVKFQQKSMRVSSHNVLLFALFLFCLLCSVSQCKEGVTSHPHDDVAPKLHRRESRTLVLDDDKEEETLSQMNTPNQIITESINENSTDVSAIDSIMLDDENMQEEGSW